LSPIGLPGDWIAFRGRCPSIGDMNSRSTSLCRLRRLCRTLAVHGAVGLRYVGFGFGSMYVDGVVRMPQTDGGRGDFRDDAALTGAERHAWRVLERALRQG
jgi:hypothetical protein